MKKKVLCLMFCMLILMGLVGCQKKEEKAEPTATVATYKSVDTITIYTINSDTMTLLPVSVKKQGTKKSAKAITDLVTQNLNDDEINIVDVAKEDKKVIITFSQKGKPIRGCNKKMENLILECYSNSVLDNVKGCTKIVFRSDVGAYKSANHTFRVNEVYASQ